MSEIDFSEKRLSPTEELKELQSKESRCNLSILLKEKEIQKLKSQLQEIESKITQNKKSYSTSNTKTCWLHPFIIEEFELYKKDLLETHQKICSLTQENFFKRNSEAPATTTLLKHAVDFMDRTSRDVQGELTQEKIDYHRQAFDRKQKNIADLEQKLKENRSYIRHLENDISETEDLIMLLSAKINETENQCEELRKENSKIAPKGKKN